MASHHSHAALPYPIYAARYTIILPYLDADGDPVDPDTPDTEISKDAGGFANVEGGTTVVLGNGLGYVTLSSQDTMCNMGAVVAKVASGPKNTLATIYPRRLPVISSGTIASGSWSVSGGTLATLLPYDITNCFIRQTRTGAGINQTNEARRIASYNTSTGAYTVSNDLEIAPSDNSMPYDILLPEGVTLGMLKTLRPATDGRTLGVGNLGHAALDWGNMTGQSAVQNLDGTRVRLHTDYDLYYATEIRLTRDQANARDEYTVAWTFDGAPITSGITSPTVEVVKRSDGTSLVAETAMTQVGSTGVYKYDETTEANRVSFGEAVIVIARATIDGETRTTRKVITLDSV